VNDFGDPYEEMLDGLRLIRFPPNPHHELICDRLHRVIHTCLAHVSTARSHLPRAAIQVAANTSIRPDLALTTTATDKLWLAAEIVDPADHHADTVLKKALYEDLRIPRLWMIDPRYDNLEIYHGTPHGLRLFTILASHQALTENLLPTLRLKLDDLFRPSPTDGPSISTIT
jgi:hypothetical protein